MKIISTICSRHKKEDPEFLAAGERYTGIHIEQVKHIANELKLPLYFLSGKYGLISETTPIPYYDYYLEDNTIDALIKVVIGQIHKDNISEVEFYSEDKSSWTPYKTVIEIAAKEVGIIFNNHSITQ